MLVEAAAYGQLRGVLPSHAPRVDGGDWDRLNEQPGSAVPLPEAQVGAKLANMKDTSTRHETGATNRWKQYYAQDIAYELYQADIEAFGYERKMFD